MSFDIQVAVPDLSALELEYVRAAMESTWISSTGPFVTRFEKRFAEQCGSGTAIAVCNGTVALHLALLTLDIRPNDEVIVPSLTYVATANAVRYVGAEPVFVDVDSKTWCIDPGKIEEAITPRTKAIIPVHLYGHPADMDAINHIAAVNGLWVVEDAAEAPTARYKGRPVGSLASIATFSFYGNKIYTSGEGGAVTLSDPRLDLRCRTLRGQGVDPSVRYHFPVIGYNYRLTNLACAILCAQLERSEEILRRRHEIYAAYRSLLDDVPGLGFQPVAPWATLAPWLFSITVDPGEFGITRDELMTHLAAHGIDTRPFFRPVHRLPPYREASRLRGEHLGITDALSACGMNLPTYPGLSDEQINNVCAAIRGACRFTS